MAKFVVYIPEQLSTKVEEEISRTGILKSEIVRRALSKYYNMEVIKVHCGNQDNKKSQELSNV